MILSASCPASEFGEFKCLPGASRIVVFRDLTYAIEREVSWRHDAHQFEVVLGDLKDHFRSLAEKRYLIS